MNSRNPPNHKNEQQPIQKNNFPVVGIGCSAGSLKFLEIFFKQFPDNPGISIVIVKHLDPHHQSELHKILLKYTHLKVKFVEDKENLIKNVVYLAPPGKNVRLRDYKLYLEEPKEPRGHRLPIDFFFRSMAKDLEDKSIGVLLSGTGTDGTLGLRDIKGRGGIAIVQDPKETEYSGMLKSAITHVKIDYILPTEEIPIQVLRYIKDYVKPYPRKDFSQQISQNLEPVFRVLEKMKGKEVLVYKNSTLSRRISKRMATNHIKKTEEYSKFLEAHPGEIEKLFSEVLIGVTDFFRDKDSFKKLNNLVIPGLVNKKTKDDTIRIWVIGCSTGEEAYTIAILLKDYMKKEGKYKKVMIFATDPNANAIKKARSRVFPENIATKVPQDYLRKYFNHEDSIYRVKKEIRDMIIFSIHNVIIDPPFSELDLISCRNLLIYLKSDIQKLLLKIFHYSLRKEGFLFLGTSESIGPFSDAFSEIDRKSKIFKKEKKDEYLKDYPRPFPPLIDYSKTRNPTVSEIIEKPEKEKINYKKIIEDFILKDYSPSGLILNANNEIIYTHGRTGKYLELPRGKAELNIFRMARKGLKSRLKAAIRKARTTENEIKYENIDVKTNGEKIRINLIIRPIEKHRDKENLLLLLFYERLIKPIDFPEDKFEKLADKVAQQKIKQLENELSATRTHLRSTVKELETTNEELQSANEELQSSNEELKTTNEELQSSKEELQSVNEELMTVNEELENKIEELTVLNNDLNNLIRSAQISTIFLDLDLKIKRFTPPVKEIFNLIDNDLGRNISDISTNLEYSNLKNDIIKVQKELNPIEKDVKTESNKWYTMRIMPYITDDKHIEGTTITFFDITERKIANQKVKKSQQKYKVAFKQAKFYQDLITHDFNNILTVLSLSLSQIKSKSKGEIKEQMEFLMQQIKRGGELVHNIQRISQINGDFATTNSIELIEMLKNQLKKIKKRYPNETIDIDFDYGEERVLVEASNFLEEAFLNLLNNSIDHNESDRKKINLRVGSYVQNEKEFYKVVIEDNGVGIPETMKKKILEGKLSPKKDLDEGLGIGLSVVKKIIKLSNGKMRIENRVEADYSKGTRFILLLPKYNDSGK